LNIKQLNSGLIDLIHNKAYQLDQFMEVRWQKHDRIDLSVSEWTAISLAYQREKIAIAEVARKMDISRQATHKLIRNLEQKELLAIHQLENNKKAKSIQLTEEGVACYEKRRALKSELEQEVISKLGEEPIKALKSILKQDWGI